MYWLEECHECHQGRVIVWKRLPDGPLFLMCEECELTARNIEDYRNRVPMGRVDFPCKAAEFEDIRHGGWREDQFHFNVE
jgi:hypothetical protein